MAKKFIDAEITKNAIQQLCNKYNITFDDGYDGFGDNLKKILDTIQAADVQEVVRCKDCKMYTDNIKDDKLRNGFCNRIECEYFDRRKPDDFCNYGIRVEKKVRQRDKLIKLLKDGNCVNPLLCDHGCKYAHLDKNYEERTADYLLEHNVIILPFNIGDEVYVLDTLTNRIDSYTIGEIFLSSNCITYQAYSNMDYNLKDFFVFDEYDIDRTVFLSKEKAEKIAINKNNF